MISEQHHPQTDASLALLALVNMSSLSLFISAGKYNLGALIAYASSAVLLALLLVHRGFKGWATQSRRWSSRFLYFSLLLMALFQLLRPRLRYVANTDLYITVRLITVLVFFIIAFQYLRSRSTRVPNQGVSLLVVAGLLVVLMFLLVPIVSPDPFIDVVVVYEESGRALLEGLNPYDLTYTNIYHPSTYYYPAGEARYYPYPPLTLIVGLVSLVTGDSRWLLIAAHLVTSFILFRTALARGVATEESLLVALLFLYVPAGLFVAESGWIDPLIALSVAAVSYLVASGRVRLSLIVAGCAIALKQTMIVFVPLLATYWLRNRWRRLLVVLAIPAFTYLGFALWNWTGLLEDLVDFHLHSPFRPDGLTLSSLMFRLTGEPLPLFGSLLPILFGVGLGIFLLYRGGSSERSVDPPKTQRSVLLWTVYALVFLVALLFSKHAFANYYYYYHFLIVLSLLWARAAALSPKGSST